jgi:hypothetical protein
LGGSGDYGRQREGGQSELESVAELIPGFHPWCRCAGGRGQDTATYVTAATSLKVIEGEMALHAVGLEHSIGYRDSIKNTMIRDPDIASAESTPCAALVLSLES